MRKYYKYTMNITWANILAIIIMIVTIIPVTKYINYFFENDLKNLVLLCLLYIIWMFLHEALHGLAHILCGVKPKELSYGAKLEKSVLFCLVRREVSKKDILISLIFPFFFIGVVTYIVALIIDSPMLALLSVFNMSGASMDLIMFYHFSKMKNDITYIEPGDGTSFYLMSNNPVKKLFGLKLVEEGEYKKDMFKDIKYKSFDISKTSLIILIVYIVMVSIAMFL